MFRRLRPWAVLLWMFALQPVEANAPRAAIRASMVLKVSAREDAAKALVQQLEVLEGYFSIRTQDTVVARVPIDQVKPFLAFAETLGVVAERSYDTQDLGFELDQLRSRLASREEMLGRYFTVLETAGTDGVLSVEGEISRLVGEIEGMKGTLQLSEHRLAFAEVSVSFQFRDRAAPTRDGRSSFPWLNTMNLSDLVEDFQRER